MHTQTHTYSGLCYNERMLQQTVFINKIRMLQRTQMLINLDIKKEIIYTYRVKKLNKLILYYFYTHFLFLLYFSCLNGCYGW